MGSRLSSADDRLNAAYNKHAKRACSFLIRELALLPQTPSSPTCLKISWRNDHETCGPLCQILVN